MMGRVLRCMSPELARLRHAARLGNCLLIGPDRKLPADGQVDAIDPS